ncbi:hypothetical protein DN824_03080 [Stutzerimonas nosocomialis]|uniref:Uncharacterized protein n=1 Tax=Stutzerimonas nosocomialis TaxID=1056496 RepID=A0A5R9QGP5_9GAMM|nr:hypothetical protein [Stutzerimonas nosocomialis]TLX54119.1 hypothetical protein DN826_15395 [Stutzerimonas nosocomialis]TLX60926.1 hypothetical protein DN824_03080 [Stutzerimonas nosocomialis]TLX64178.1 hypothetical protein DN820_07620 [Stutzerimonas nosocomialis]
MFGLSKSHKFEVNYIFRNDPRVQIIESEQDSFSQADAIRHLIELHNADAENNLAMPEPGADEAELTKQAEVLGISDIRVTRLVHEHEKGTSPGHYQQP